MMVAAGHLSFLPFGLSPGVIAVTCFYAISGYAMNVLVENSFGPAAGDRTTALYRDRLFRSLPQYCCWLAIAAVLMALGWRDTVQQTGPKIARRSDLKPPTIPISNQPPL